MDSPDSKMLEMDTAQPQMDGLKRAMEKASSKWGIEKRGGAFLSNLSGNTGIILVVCHVDPSRALFRANVTRLMSALIPHMTAAVSIIFLAFTW